MTAKAVCPYCRQSIHALSLLEIRLPEYVTLVQRLAALQRCVRCQQLFVLMRELNPKQLHTDQVWLERRFSLTQEKQRDLFIQATLCPAPHNAHCSCALHVETNTLVTQPTA